MGQIFLEVVTPGGLKLSQDVDTVVAPGTEGEFGVLPGHINFLTGIVPGELRFSSKGRVEYMAVNSGFAEVSGDRVSIIVDSAENASEIDVKRAQAALERAKKRLEQVRHDDDIDSLRAESALKRAISRLKVVKKGL